MAVSEFESLRLLFILLSSYSIVCLASVSFPPSEQTTFQSSDRHVEQTNRRRAYESRLQVQKLLNLESEVISLCWLIMEKDEMLHHSEADHHDSEHIKRFLTETQRINDVTLGSHDVIERHPVLVFRLRRRIAVSWLPIIKDIRKCKFVTTFLQTSIGFRFMQLSDVLFRECDLERAVDDIFFLQRIYCLQTQSLVAGCIHGACVEPFSQDEVKDMAQSAVDKENYKLALEWIETGLGPSCGQNCPPSSGDDQSIMTLRASALLMEKRYDEAKKAYQELFLRSNSSSRAIASILRTIEERQKKNEDDGAKTDQTSTENKKTVSECKSSKCLDQPKQTKDQQLSLPCYSLQTPTAEDESINFEILNRDPKVVVVYNFLRRDQIEFLRTSARRKDAATSGIYFASTVQRIRLTSDDQWMDAIGSQYRNMTYSRARHGVEIDREAFHLTVMSIGAGHRNSLTSMEKEATDEVFGKHVGQFHVFLNEPEFGGRLIFPKLNLYVEPTQGAAVFWQFRSASSPSVDDAFKEILECPILLGTQWVAKIPLLHPSLGLLNF